MKDNTSINLKIQTLEASNKRLRKHLRQAKRQTIFPSSSNLTNCLSEDLFLSCRNIEQSSMSVNAMLQKGTSYIIQRYQKDIKNIIQYIDGKININKLFPLHSDSCQLLEQLINKIFKLKAQAKPQPAITPKLPSNLNKLVKDYSQLVIDNQNKYKLVLHMQQVVQRLHFQQQICFSNTKIIKELANKFVNNIHEQNKLSATSKMRSVVIAIRFSYRLSKGQKQIAQIIQKTNLNLIQSPFLYRKLYRSYLHKFQYEENQSSIKRLVHKDPERALLKLLNLPIFFQRHNIRPIQIKINKKQIQPIVSQKTEAMQQLINNLQTQLSNTKKQFSQQKQAFDKKFEEYKNKVKVLNRKVSNLQSKIKKNNK